MNCDCGKNSACEGVGTAGCGNGLVVMVPIGPWSREGNRHRRRRLRVGHRRGKRRVLLVALAGEEVRVVEHQRGAGTDHRLAVTRRIERDAEVGRELHVGVLA